ncbi:winged helix-turn-helix transcriptional regulator [Frankia sp. CNm7]|uniref:Winged helix-turn-helix transcriptional regulator n=1 Tax=Frankia nepalensis TaxID=1836974 RepID=A0A937UPT1_9ACTN|nr:MarR family winged helix-turn-helix transcriptional regulator [Frankia nepalensis]MBL7496582.1 winged helix-turn-helix transcriptional regulator [Frankia nepalensis]MBL7508801.1 winged helix-turn-helix transcriptional regulator [Frankia nepalensis]MBL7520215.1 winged helix-turn-helix transcriptional regulator [Frankia nepalensis]MBL7627555.1 winged helix-turn-helix transcriptional regulator [Frankia nepalensis]
MAPTTSPPVEAGTAADEPAPVGTHVPGALVLLTRLGRQVYRDATEDLLGMGLKQFVVLNQLREDVGTPQQRLAEHLCLGANILVLLLNGVESAGWAERRRDPADRRRHLVHRTPAGTAALARAEQAMDSVEDLVLGHLSPDERATLRALLARALGD